MIWAIDLYAKHPVRESTLKIIEFFCERGSAQVQPVYVAVYPESSEAASPSSSGQWVPKGYLAEIQKEFESQMFSVTSTRFLPPQALVNIGFSMRRSALMLLNYAQSTGVDLIVADSGGLGDFVDALLALSPIPVLAIPTQTKFKGFDSILFATNLTPESLRSFDATVALAAQLKSQIVIFHQLPTSLFGFSRSIYGVGWSLDRHAERAHALARQLAELARVKGVSAEIWVEKSEQPVETAILKASRKKEAGLIALSSVLLGKIGREVIRGAQVPVWIRREPEIVLRPETLVAS